MLRSSPTSRSLLTALTKVKVQHARLSYSAAVSSPSSSKLRPAASLQLLHDQRPRPVRSIGRPPAGVLSLLYATKSTTADPKHVSADSGVRHVFEGGKEKTTQNEDAMLAGVKADWVTIKETFSMGDVPKESLYLGMAGLLPYAATSLSTVVLAYDINHAHATGGTGYFFAPETAHQLLDLVTPIQIGFGAVIISFLGAIHWGLEYAGYGGHHGYRRFMIGVAAPAVAWPTIFMPVEYALIAQFLAFNALYFADARATVRGWFPPWYSTYRFVLTFIVGASIVASLVGRGQIVSSDGRLKSSVDYVKDDRDAQWQALEREERERRATLANEEEEKSEEEDEGEDEGDKADKKKKDAESDKDTDNGSDASGKK